LHGKKNILVARKKFLQHEKKSFVTINLSRIFFQGIENHFCGSLLFRDCAKLSKTKEDQFEKVGIARLGNSHYFLDEALL